ncbi:MAG: alanine--tRNA ligase [Nanoarchaeota archaeon]
MNTRITRKQLIKKYVNYFISNPEFPHKEIPNSSLVPNLEAYDTGVLFTTAGMHPLVAFLLGEKHAQGKRLVNIQKCIRTGDIEEVGDTTHHTFFEMLGNWSLGDYFKKEAIKMSFGFLTKELEIPKERLAVTCFKGDEKNKIPKDTESAEIWKSLGIPKQRIAYTKKDNWWGPAGSTGPCGPDTEMFYWKPNPEKQAIPEKFNPDDERWVEIWNDVLMQYNKNSQGNFEEAKQKNIDTGMGLERTIAVLNDLEDNYLSEVWKPIIEKIEEISGKDYNNEANKKPMRIIADHIKAAVMIIAEDITPSNTEQGYVLRRLIRRAVRYGRDFEMQDKLIEIAKPIFEIYKDYSSLIKNKEKILNEIKKEQDNFLKKIEDGEKILKKFIDSGKKEIDKETSFLLYQSYGFPLELTKEIAKERGIKVDEPGFYKELKKHQELSRTASAGKFKSGLADNSEQTTKLHTATHLLNQALREVLKNKEIYQKGSNINPERLRFDFNFPRKLTDEEKQDIENWINDKIKQELPINVKEMSLTEAKDFGAQGIFEDKYQNMNKIKVYFIGPDKKGNYVSKEICSGPHVKNTKELGKFKIKKEESSSSGVRRIKGVLE